LPLKNNLSFKKLGKKEREKLQAREGERRRKRLSETLGCS